MNDKSPNIAAGLGWLGVTLLLLPLAVICSALIVALALTNLTAGFIVLSIIAASIGGRLDKRRKARKTGE